MEKSDLQESGFIDAHVHVWTPDTKRYPLAPGFSKEDMKPPSFTPEELFAHCRPCGVTRIVLIQMSYYNLDNSYMLDVMRAHPGVFSGVAIVDENDEPHERMKELATKGVRGFRIRMLGRKPDEWLAGSGADAMWKQAAESSLNICPLINPEYLPSVDAMCEKHPDTPVVVDHFARVGVDGNIRDAQLEDLCKLARHANVKLKVSAYYALGKKKAPYTDLGGMFRRVYDAFGPQRLMWASDCPFQVVDGHEYRPSIELVKERLEFLSATDRDWILRGTAAETFF